MNPTKASQYPTNPKPSAISMGDTENSEHTIGFSFSDHNLFPEAIALFPRPERIIKNVGPISKREFAQHLIIHIERHCQMMDDQAKAMVEGILGEFGEFLILRTPQKQHRMGDRTIVQLLGRLYRARDHQQFFLALNDIRTFCQTIF